MYAYTCIFVCMFICIRIHIHTYIYIYMPDLANSFGGGGSKLEASRAKMGQDGDKRI